jgi:hypothetical protein
MHPTSTVNLAGTEYELRFDIVGLTSAQTLMKAMGFPRNNAWSLADTPYDLGEEIVLVLNGINGARRLAKNPALMTMEEAQQLVEAHFDYIAGKTELAESDAEAMEMFNTEQQKLMESLGTAVRASMGFRRGPKGGAPGRV